MPNKPHGGRLLLLLARGKYVSLQSVQTGFRRTDSKIKIYLYKMFQNQNFRESYM
jgi:hypothetical protein